MPKFTRPPRQRERLQAVVEDLAAHPVQTPERQRLLRALRAVFHEIRLLEDRIAACPEALAAAGIRPMEDVERDHILAAVKQTDSVAEAARRLGIGQATLYRRLARYGMKRRPWVSGGAT